MASVAARKRHRETLPPPPPRLPMCTSLRVVGCPTLQTEEITRDHDFHTFNVSAQFPREGQLKGENLGDEVGQSRTSWSRVVQSKSRATPTLWTRLRESEEFRVSVNGRGLPG